VTREEQVAELLLADTTLLGILPGGIYTYQEVGVEGIRRGDGSPTAQAFDSEGRLLPCAWVIQRGLVPDEQFWDLEEKMVSTQQIVQIFFYEFRGHAAIEAAKQRSYVVLQGETIAQAYPLQWDFETGFFPDVGPVANSTTLRQDWRINSIRKP